MKSNKQQGLSKYVELVKPKIKLAGKYVGAAYAYIKKQRDVFPVVAFALIPALAFWGGSNKQELSLALMLRTLIAMAALSLIYYAVFYFIMERDKFKASVMAILLTTVSLSYGEVYDYYFRAIRFVSSPENLFTEKDIYLKVIVVGFVILTIIVKKKLKPNKILRDYMLLFAAILLAYNTYPLIKNSIDNRHLKDLKFGSPIEVAPGREKTNTPDIYYLIFDRYGANKTFQKEYGFDNTPFLNSLREDNFYVAEDSTANYPATTLSLSSSLNLDYLPEEYKSKTENGIYTSLLHEKIEDNQVVHFLKKKGYSFTNIGPWWSATKYSRYADQNLYNPEGVTVLNRPIDMQEHEHLLFQNTIFFRLSRNAIKLGDFTLYGRTYPDNDTAGRAVHKQTMEHQFEKIKGTAHQPGPKYVFGHILLPHNPYVVDEKCKHMKKNNDEEYVNYIRQLQCANTKIQDMVDYILANSKNDPIIVIQADEGPYPIEYVKNKKMDWTKAEARLLQHKHRILNTYHFPDKDYSKLYPSISPVNSFRVILNQYFGTEYPLLEDKQYFSESSDKRFQLVDMSDKFKQE